MNRVKFSICALGVVAAGYAPVVLYANQDTHASVQAIVAPSAPAGAAEVATGSIDPRAVTVAVWTPPRASFAAPLDETALKGTPLAAHSAESQAVYADALPAAYEGDYDSPIWAVVTRGAKLHADPDVSSPTTWFYGVGTKLNVVGYRQGWYQVVDPETSRRGFIYAQYYLDALRGPTDTPVVAKAPVLTQTALAEPAPAVAPKSAAHHGSRLNPMLLGSADTPAAIPVSAPRPRFTASRPDGVAGLLEQALRR